MGVTVSAAAGSAVGRRYAENYDVVHLGLEPLVAVVADGMGDGLGSRRAGRTAVDAFVARCPSTVDGVAEAQRLVGAIGGELGMLAGCTLTALIQVLQGFRIVHIGDSRVYRLRRGLLELLTVDHTMAWLGAVHGWYPFDSPQAASARYHLTRYVGHPDRPEPDVLEVVPAVGDVFLLCTDGVAEQVSYQRLHDVLGSGAAPRRMVDELLASADEGGLDNATALVVRFDRA
ncbi:protein phosphatase 2C domain-containing protein [Actinosynnema sp. NPDC020468]|uniref:PP2C family protein-serine/threonine phosphatase n=1 Tax=Actinosynnema sp. NPDC020468 TaxID=3154488 RepID=UPI0033D01C8E